MFVDEKSGGESNGYQRFADAIRRGHQMIGEDLHTLSGCAGCAMGAALVAEGLELARGWALAGPTADRLAKHFGIDVEVVMEVSATHFWGKATRLECADWLEHRSTPLLVE